MKFLNKDGVTYLWGKIKTALNGKQDTLTFDNAPTEGSDNPVKSGGVKEALDGKKNTQTAVSSPAASGSALAFIDTITQNEQGVIAATKKSVTVDATPTANSTNPVQSGGVKAALDGKQSTLTFDNVPTANSNNPVKSNGIKAALDEKQNTIGKGINLLDNWYFVGGGSQQGDGQFPINQHGSTSYSGINGTIFTIDRWRLNWWSTGHSITINKDYITLKGGSKPGAAFSQRFKLPYNALKGKYVTFSCLLGNNSLFSYTHFVPNVEQDFNTNESILATGAYLRFGYLTQYKVFYVTFYLNNNQETTYKAVKLEIGKVQTLARQENGEWVLNDPPPNYDMELLKCQLSTADPSDTYANRKLIPITANMGTVTGTGSTVTVTKTVTGVTANMTVDRIEFGTPSAVQSGWTVTTAAGSVTFSATISGSTTVKIKLSDNMDVTGT